MHALVARMNSIFLSFDRLEYGDEHSIEIHAQEIASIEAEIERDDTLTEAQQAMLLKNVETAKAYLACYSDKEVTYDF